VDLDVVLRDIASSPSPNAAVIERERSRPGKDWEVVRGFLDFAKGQSTAGVLPVTPRFIDEASARRRINSASKMGYDAEQRFNALAPP
jgi:hypothetical protein